MVSSWKLFLSSVSFDGKRRVFCTYLIVSIVWFTGQGKYIVWYEKSINLLLRKKNEFQKENCWKHGNPWPIFSHSKNHISINHYSSRSYWLTTDERPRSKPPYNGTSTYMYMELFHHIKLVLSQVIVILRTVIAVIMGYVIMNSLQSGLVRHLETRPNSM